MPILVEIGVVDDLWRFPVKSMAGESLDGVYVKKHGFEHDRLSGFMHRKSTSSRNAKRFLTAREYPGLVTYTPCTEAQVIRAPDGRLYSLGSAELLERLQDEAKCDDLELRLDPARVHDNDAVSLVSNGSLDALGTRETQRYRMNVILDMYGDAFGEDKLVGNRIGIGSEVRLRVTKKVPRCVMVDVDPLSGILTPGHLKGRPNSVAKMNRGFLGVYSIVEQTGRIQVGDSVYLA